MTEQTQIQKTVSDIVQQLDGCSDSEYNEKCLYLFQVILPPKQPNDTTKDKKSSQKEEEPVKNSTEPKTETQSLNPAFVQKELNTHFDQLQKLYDNRRNENLGNILVRLLVVFHQDEHLPKHLSELLLKTGQGVYTVWGNDFVRNAGIYVAQYYKLNPSHELFALIEAATDYLVKIEYIIEMLDCVLEMNDFQLIAKYINADNVLKFTYYLKQNLFYASDPKNYQPKMFQLFDILVEKLFLFNALDIAMEFNDYQKIETLYQVIKKQSRGEQVQFCLILSQYSQNLPRMFEDDQQLTSILCNNHKAPAFLEQTKKLNLEQPKLIDEVLKRKDIEVDWGKLQNYTSNFFMNAFIHIGYQDDYLLNSHIPRDSGEAPGPSESQVQTAAAEVQNNQVLKNNIPEGHNLFIFNSQLNASKADITTSIAAASIGVLNMWTGYQKNFEFCQKYANSPDKWVRAGSLLAYGLSAHGCITDAPFDFLINFLGGQFNPFYDGCQRGENNKIISTKYTPKNLQQQYQNTSMSNIEAERIARNNNTIEFLNSKEAIAAFSMGIAYMQTGNVQASDILINRLQLCSTDILNEIPLLEKNPRCYACLALGLINAGSGNIQIADTIVRIMAGNSRSQRALRFFPLCCIAVSLIFLKFCNKQENEKIVEDYCSTLQEKLNSVPNPDSINEHLPVVAREDNTQLAAYLQALIHVCAYANQGNIHVIQDLMQAMTDSVQGRVAAEEAVSISKFDKETQFNKVAQNMDQYVAETGNPLTIANSDRSIWPGDNLDPSTILVVGLGLLLGNDEITTSMITRFAERILKYANMNAQRAVPLLLALTSLSTINTSIIEDLSKLALHTDKTMCFNALLALGLVGCGTQNFKIAGVLRHCLESKFYSEDNVEHVVFGAQLAFGLLNAGKGAVCIQKGSLTQLASLATVLLFAAPSSEVLMRPKSQFIFYLLSCAMQPKTKSAIDSEGKDVVVQVRSGRSVEELSGEKPFRLAGFCFHDTPIVAGPEDQVVVVDDNYSSIYQGYKGVAGLQCFVVKKNEENKEKNQAKDSSKDKKNDDIYQ